MWLLSHPIAVSSTQAAPCDVAERRETRDTQMFKTVQAEFAEKIILPIYKLKLQRFEALVPQAQEIQNQFLIENIARCAETRFGRDHSFSQIKTIDDFRQRVPFADYQDLVPYVTAVTEGQTDALFPATDKILCFATTSGTTGEPKIVTVTKRWLNAYRGAWEVWGLRNFADHPDVIGNKKLLQITAPTQLGTTPSGHLIAQISALTARYQNPLLKAYYPLPLEVANIRDPEVRYYTILRITLLERIGFITTITPSNLIRLAEMGNTHAESLIRDIHDGCLNLHLTDCTFFKRSMIRKLKIPRPDAARKLENIIAKTGTLYPKDYWPLSIISCWLGGTVGYQSENLGIYYGDVPRRDPGYLSAEGRHTIPMEDHSSGGILSFNSGSYYEFVPADQALTANANVYDGSELRTGGEYQVVITSSNGLWRYIIGDVVRCKGHIGSAPILEFLYKVGYVSDMENEKLSGLQVVQAVKEACAVLNKHINYFTFIPIRRPRETPYYGAILEDGNFEGGEERERFMRLVDNSLIAQNLVYAGRRNDKFIGPPQLIRIKPGSWEKLIRLQTEGRGTDATQYKHPPIITDPRWIEDLNTVSNANIVLE